MEKDTQTICAVIQADARLSRRAPPMFWKNGTEGGGYGIEVVFDVRSEQAHVSRQATVKMQWRI